MGWLYFFAELLFGTDTDYYHCGGWYLFFFLEGGASICEVLVGN